MRPPASTGVSQLPILLADDFPLQYGGIQRYMGGLADALHNLRGNVTVVAPRAHGDVFHDSEVPYRVVRYGARSRFGKVRQILDACKACEPPDYTLAALWFPGGLAALVAPSGRRGKLGILVHGSDILKPSGAGRLLMKRVLARADAVIANSAYTRDLFALSGPKRSVYVSHCGVQDFYCGAARSSTPIVLSVGRLIRRKGFDVLLGAFQIVLRHYPDAVCEIIGDGPERASLERLAGELNILSSIRFLGAVNDASLHAAYGRAWCFALPARREKSDVEGFGIVYLEAAIAGLAVVAGRESGARDAVVENETGLLVDSRHPTDVARAILTLISNRSISGDMGSRGRERALREFSWRESARRIDHLMTSDRAGSAVR